ncbi:hypothetical protein SAMN04488029_3415 [Reichenbachiella faecimaris]|uniref:DUF1440 domain-containing protein n=1 Tax=Reichenbachiella faecimaris TaxID=692418 RepID=A0A1W2GN58_REIFA|nr:hypothetical protein [Reichenbachiella faecimaris]SMD37696.1 hypothetical protein SAMN04488029_3415 [Reichenbachiella faecimaris]
MKIKTILLSGLLIGSLDILAAFIDFYITTGNGPAGVLRYIASGAFGNEAFSGGSFMILWGLFFHYLIAYSFSILFFWLYRHVRWLSTYPITTVILYGIFMWIITVLIIVPISNTPPVPLTFLRAIKAILILIFMISLPLVIVARKRTNDWSP